MAQKTKTVQQSESEEESKAKSESLNGTVFVIWAVLMVIAGIYMAYKFVYG